MCSSEAKSFGRRVMNDLILANPIFQPSCISARCFSVWLSSESEMKKGQIASLAGRQEAHIPSLTESKKRCHLTFLLISHTGITAESQVAGLAEDLSGAKSLPEVSSHCLYITVSVCLFVILFIPSPACCVHFHCVFLISLD